ncbi:MAG: Y4bD/Y4pK family protein [Thermoleophilia bacterium]|nr:Y4bD/Y4pK family protein [Thermoleophilia bacterium]
MVTHPFHPLTGQEFELVGYAHTWGEHRVFFRRPGQKRVRSLPASWTDMEGVDPFLALSAGRAHFRVEELVALVSLVQELKSREV